jgi:cation transport regulator ChaC
MTRIAVFGYGSLVDPTSAAITLGRPVPAPRPARLRGWRRRWSIARDNLRVEKTFALEAGGELPPWILGLNLERDPGAEGEPPNGALVELSEDELDRLDLREMRYDRVEVTGEAEGGEDLGLVVAYVTKPEHFSPRPPEGAVVMRSYLETVECAFAALGDGQLEAFRRSTGPPPVEVVDAVLVRDRIPPGNPRRW